MTTLFSPQVEKVAALVSDYLSANTAAMEAIGFYGSNWGPERVGYVVVPLVLRKAISRVHNSDDRFKNGPCPPRKDGGYGWFAVQETPSGQEDMPDPAASGCNLYYDAGRPERGMFAYLWSGKYHNRELCRQGIGWLFKNDVLTRVMPGAIPAGLLNEEALAQMIRLHLVERAAEAFRLTIPVFTPAQYERLQSLLDPLAGQLEALVSSLVVRIWREFHTFVPARIADQINQYVAGYSHRLIGLTMFQMISNGTLVQPPAQGPLPGGIFYVDKPVLV